MSLKSTTQKAVNKAFKALDSFMFSAILVQKASPQYIPGTGEVQFADEEYALKILIGEFSNHQIDGTAIQTGDKTGTVEVVKLISTPMPGDIVTIGDGVRYVILRVTGDPAEATLILHLRSVQING